MPITPTNPTLSEICKIISKDLEIVESKLLEKTANTFDFVNEAVLHVIAGGGKRIRPLLLLLSLLSAKACGYGKENRENRRDRAYEYAAMLELIHVASLVHDDVIDEALMRRGRQSLNSKWGNKVAVLVGDYLHARVLSMLVKQNSSEAIMAILADATQSMCEGEVIHAYKSHDFDLPEADYMKIINYKTGKLITAACSIGANLSTENEKLINAFTEYGSNIGAAFQMVDDILDYIADDANFGKKTGGDLCEGKLTFPIIHLRDSCSSDEKDKLQKLFYNSPKTDEEVEYVQKLMAKYQTSEQCLLIAQEYADKSKKALKAVKNSEAKEAMIKIADYIVRRDR